MEFNDALVMFFCGVVAHATGIRLFTLWSKKAVYKTTYISSLAILRMSEGFAKDVMKASGLEDEDEIEATFSIWRAVALNSLNTVLPDLAWRSNCIHNWDEAMRTITALQKKGDKSNDFE